MRSLTVLAEPRGVELAPFLDVDESEGWTELAGLLNCALWCFLGMKLLENWRGIWVIEDGATTVVWHWDRRGEVVEW